MLTSHTGLKTQPRLIRFNFDAAANKFVIAAENEVAPLDKVDKV